MMRIFLATAAIGAAALVISSGLPAMTAASTPGITRAALALPLGGQEVGKAIFEGKGNCASCHGRDARGGPLGPDLADGEWLHISGTLDEITTIIRSGVMRPKKFPAPMPPLGGARLRDAELTAVARYVFELGPVPTAETRSERPEQETER